MTKTLLLLSLVGPVLGISASESLHKNAKTIVLQPQAKLTVLDKDLLKAVKEENVAEIEKLIEEGADVNAQDGHGWTALLCAAEGGLSAVCLKLIEEGFVFPQVDSKDVNEFLKKCVSLLCSFKRFAKENKIIIPKDIQYLILKTTWKDKIDEKDTLPKLEMLVIYLIRSGCAHCIPLWLEGLKNNIIAALAQQTFESLKKMMKDALREAKNAEIKALLNPATLNRETIEKKLIRFSQRRNQAHVKIKK